MGFREFDWWKPKCGMAHDCEIPQNFKIAVNCDV